MRKAQDEASHAGNELLCETEHALCSVKGGVTSVPRAPLLWQRCLFFEEIQRVVVK